MRHKCGTINSRRVWFVFIVVLMATWNLLQYEQLSCCYVALLALGEERNRKTCGNLHILFAEDEWV